MSLELIEERLCFGGIQRVYSHESVSTRCTMRFALFLPPQAQKQKVPVLYWLSGLTCNEQNFITKSGAQRMAAKLGLGIVVPDTSPRGIDLPGDRDNYDFGIGAGFYLDAIQAPWSEHYCMATYVRDELPELIQQHFPFNHRACGIFGHSMGGHGALTLALNNPDRYHSVSAFAPICAPMQCSWGQKAFSKYLGEDRNLWKKYDACELVAERGWPHRNILVDQGADDPYLEEQLNPELFRIACAKADLALNLRMRNGYDHSYYFISSFIADHLIYHATLLGNSSLD